mgnify:CR=1 FL=1
MVRAGVDAASQMVVGVLGPTGVGKTAVGVELAAMLGTRVISCDSLQIYRGLPILTNQPSGAERCGVRHEMVGIAEPLEEWSAAQYARAVRPLIEQDLETGGAALLVGGTGLYMRAAVAPLAAPPPAPRVLQQELEARAAIEGPAALHAELSRLDPAAAAAIDPRNVRRLVRALAVVKTSVSVEGDEVRWSGRSDLWDPIYYHHTMLVGLTLPRTELYARINLRTQHMLQQGAVAEVAAILEQHGRTEEGRRALERGIGKAIGFRLLAAHLEGEMSLEEVEEKLSAATRAYARRQLTWMRKMPGVVIMDVSGREPGDVAAEIAAGVGHCGG